MTSHPKRETIDLYLASARAAHGPDLYFLEVLFLDDDPSKPSYITIIHRNISGAPENGTALPPGYISTSYLFAFTPPHNLPGNLEEVKVYRGDFRQAGFRYTTERMLHEYRAPQVTPEIHARAETVLTKLTNRLERLVQHEQEEEKKQRRERMIQALKEVHPYGSYPF